MEPVTEKITYPFLQGGGEMGELTRRFNWASTSVGLPGQWPAALRITVSNLLRSNFPMFLWWGEDMIQFYNDAYRPSLGNEGKHPSALGQQGKECWPETWATVYPVIRQVQLTGESVWVEDQQIPVYRNGKFENVSWTYSYSSVLDEEGCQAGILVTCTETTEKVMDLQQLEEKADQLQFAIEAMELGTWDYNPLTDKFSGNNRLKEWFGLPPEQEIDLPLALQVIAAHDRQRVTEAIQQALQYGSGGYYDAEYTIINPVTGKVRIVRAKGRAWFTNEHAAYRFNGTLQDVTDQVVIREKIEEREANLRNMILQVPVAMCIFRGPDHVIEIANHRMFRFWGRSAEDVMQKPLFEALPEAANQGYEELLANMLLTGKSFSASELPVTLPRNNQVETVYINFACEPVRDSNGSISGILAMAIDVTDYVHARKQLEEAEERIRLSLSAADLGNFEANLLTNDVITSARFDNIFGSDYSDDHRHYIQSIHPDDMHLRDQAYHRAYETGILEYEARIIWKDHSVHWIRVWGNTYFDVARNPVKLLGVVQDITERKKAEDELRNTAERLQLALQAGELGSYELQLNTGEIFCTAQCKFNFGLLETDTLNFEKLVELVIPSDKDGMQADLQYAVRGKTIYHSEYRIQWPGKSMTRWIRATGFPIYTVQGQPKKVVGITLDITEQKEFAEELSKQVKERTIALENKNRELERSNANLEEFAYAASHDLKEPIRKIHYFTSRLKSMLANRLNAEEAATFAPIERSTERMSELIDDLLLYSHVSQRPHKKETVNLNTKLNLVLEDLELDIQEKKAIIHSAHLPVISGYRRQLQQLFHNLITNALKYSKEGEIPRIDITAGIVTGKEAGSSGEEKYHLIEFRDNGIGFEQEYAEKIFHMFTRLHGKNEYSGTGVGLSIAKKVVENHNGYLNAESSPDKGAVFRIYLPVTGAEGE